MDYNINGKDIPAKIQFIMNLQRTIDKLCFIKTG
jgi:hypothetical protein